MKEALSSLRADLVHLPGGARGSLWLVATGGAIDSVHHPLFDRAAHPPPGCHSVAMDLTRVRLLAGGLKGLLRCVRQVAGSRKTLYLVVGDPDVRHLLKMSGALEQAQVRPGVQDVFEACAPHSGAHDTVSPGSMGSMSQGCRVNGTRPAGPTPVGVAERKELEVLRAEVRNLRAKVRTHPLVDQALGVLLERYGLPEPRAAFDLLRKCSEVYNVRLRTVAAALVADPRGELPLAADPMPPPPLSFLRERPGAANRGQVVNAVLDRTLEVAGTDMGSVGLTDPLLGGVRLEAYENLSEELVDFLDTAGRTGTPSALASQHLARVTITDVATDSAVTPATRTAFLAAGCRAVHSTPLTDGSGCVGVANAYMRRQGRMLTSGQAHALDEVGAEAGRWLTWHRNTVVRDALRYLDDRARSYRAGEAEETSAAGATGSAHAAGHTGRYQHTR